MALPRSPVSVSDHAVLRYLERKLRIDVEALRDDIRTVCLRGAEAEADTVVHDGVRFVLRHRGDGVSRVCTTLHYRRDYKHRRPGRDP